LSSPAPYPSRKPSVRSASERHPCRPTLCRSLRATSGGAPATTRRFTRLAPLRRTSHTIARLQAEVSAHAAEIKSLTVRRVPRRPHPKLYKTPRILFTQPAVRDSQRAPRTAQEERSEQASAAAAHEAGARAAREELAAHRQRAADDVGAARAAAEKDEEALRGEIAALKAAALQAEQALRAQASRASRAEAQASAPAALSRRTLGRVRPTGR